MQDANGYIVACNRQALSILELRRDELLGISTGDERWAPVSLSGNPIAFEDLPTTITRKTGVPQKVLLRVTTGKETFKWLTVDTKRITHNNEQFVFASFFDSTNTYSEHQQLRINEERWNLALRGSELGVWDVDVLTGEAYFSLELCGMLGYEKGELEPHINVGYHLIHPDDLPVSLKAYNDCVSGLSDLYSAELRLKCKDGSWKWIHSVGKVMAYSGDGKASRIAGTHMNISIRKEIEEKLKLSQLKFFNVFNYSAAGMAMISLEGQWLDVSPSLQEMLGYSREELLAMTFRQITHSDDISADDDHLRRTLNGEFVTYTREKRYVHKKGYIVWVLLTISLVRNGEGEPLFYMSQISDITHLKQLIVELGNNNLLLNATSNTLEKKINQLEEFSRIVAHNLRGPAGNISMLAELLSTEPENSVMYLDMLKESSSVLNDTLHQLIQILEIQLHTNIAFDECDVKQLIGKVKSMFNVQVSAGRVNIKEDIAVPIIKYPKSYLESILYNLISNSIKYRKLDNRSEIIVRTFEREGRNIIEVEDNGIGIDLKKYGHQLFKLKKVFHKGYDSKGVGLFITKNQIEALGGNISASSAPGKGSVFTIEL